MGKKGGGGLYENWLKHFTINVMTQSFHAFFLMFVMKMLSEISAIEAANAVKLTANDGLLSIMSIIGMMAIIKFEKLFKELFGLNDSLSGNLSKAGTSMLLGLSQGNKLKNELVQPFQKSKTSRNRVNALGKDLGLTKDGTNAKGRIGQYIKHGGSAAAGAGSTTASASSPLSDKTQSLYEKMKEAKQNGNLDLYKDYRDHAATQMKYERAGATQTVSGGGGQAGGTPQKTRADKIAEYNDAVLESRKDNRKKWMQTAGTLASLAMAAGATDQTHELLTAANAINDPINSITNRHIDHGENLTARNSTGDTSRYTERTLSQAIKDGFRDATKDMRNDNGKINPIKLTVEAGKTYATASYKTTSNVLRASKVDSIDDI